jgi:hypothetical protein
MTVKIYVKRDSTGRPIAPEYSHEMRTTLGIIRRLWSSFHHHPVYYAVAANLESPSADLLVFSERGIGVLELKHYYGRVTCRSDGSWYAGPIKMQSGVPGKGFRNPHEQVQGYAEEIRAQLMKPPLWKEPWLPGKAIDWPTFKFHTAVCFTHPDAEINDFSEYLRRRCRPVTLPWEDFSVFKPDDVSGWVASLRFEVGGTREGGFTRHRLHPMKIDRILTHLLDLSEWKEMADLIPHAEPYGVLNLVEEDDHNQLFVLEEDDLMLGRDVITSDILIPDRFLSVSRAHARITRTMRGVHIEDLSSTNGTYVNGTRVTRKRQLNDGDIITLGGAEQGRTVCQLQFSFRLDEITGLEKTQKL